jgi:hypothetical protein
MMEGELGGEGTPRRMEAEEGRLRLLLRPPSLCPNAALPKPMERGHDTGADEGGETLLKYLAL